MGKLFSIGEVSKLKGITIKTLRYYHKVGILVPSYIEELTGYRYYSIDQFIHIDIIKGCRKLGSSIKELQEIFKTCNTDKLLEFLQLKKIEAEQNILNMQEIIKNIDALDSAINCAKNILDSDKITIKYLPERYILATPCKEVGDLKELIYYSKLENIIKQRKVKASIESGIIINLENNLRDRYVFNVIEGSKFIEEDENIAKIPAGRYLIASYTKETEDKCIKRIEKYIGKNNINIKSYLEVDLLDDIFNIDSYSCQIQMIIE